VDQLLGSIIAIHERLHKHLDKAVLAAKIPGEGHGRKTNRRLGRAVTGTEIDRVDSRRVNSVLDEFVEHNEVRGTFTVQGVLIVSSTPPVSERSVVYVSMAGRAGPCARQGQTRYDCRVQHRTLA
jgi:hypothetical protein